MTVDNEKRKNKKRKAEDSEENPKLKIKKTKKNEKEKEDSTKEEKLSIVEEPSTVEVASEAKKPKSILKAGKKKKKTSGAKAASADAVDDDIPEEVLENLAVDEDEAPQTNPSFQPRVDVDEPAEDKDESASAKSSAKKKKDNMRKKILERRAKKATAQEAKTNSEGEEIRILEAKEYLRLWKDEKGSWKFNKHRQTWLLKNMFHKDALEDSSFSILVEYLRPLKGNAREETIKQAEAKVNQDGVDFLQAERARVIVQMLSWELSSEVYSLICY